MSEPYEGAGFHHMTQVGDFAVLTGEGFAAIVKIGSPDKPFMLVPAVATNV